MPDTLETSGGQIEHEVYMLEGIMLIALELKLTLMTKHYAQVLLELACECRYPFSYCINSEARIVQLHSK